MKVKRGSRIVSLFLSLALVLSLIPGVAFVAYAEDSTSVWPKTTSISLVEGAAIKSQDGLDSIAIKSVEYENLPELEEDAGMEEVWRMPLKVGGTITIHVEKDFDSTKQYVLNAQSIVTTVSEEEGWEYGGENPQGTFEKGSKTLLKGYSVKLPSYDYCVGWRITVVVDEPEFKLNTQVNNYEIHRGEYLAPMGTVSAFVDGEELSGSVAAGKTVSITATPKQFLGYDKYPVYDSKFDHWEIEGLDTEGQDLTQESLQFTMPECNVSVKAVFAKQGSKITLSANNYTAGDVLFNIGTADNSSFVYNDSTNSTYDYKTHDHGYEYASNIVIKDAVLQFQIEGMYDNYNPNYDLVRWDIHNDTLDSDVDVTYIEGNCNGRPYDIARFAVDGTSEYSVVAIFEAKDYGGVKVSVNDPAMGSASASAGTAQPSANLMGVVVGNTVNLNATANTGYLFKGWTASYGSDPAVEIEITNADQPNASFVMPATNHADVNVIATFEKDPNFASSECDLTDAELTDLSGNTYAADQDGTAFTITLPAGTDVSSLAQWPLTLEISEGATVAKNGDATWTNGAACGMALNTPVTFTVTAEDGTTTQDYTIEIGCSLKPVSRSHILVMGPTTRCLLTYATVSLGYGSARPGIAAA